MTKTHGFDAKKGTEFSKQHEGGVGKRDRQAETDRQTDRDA